jgi:hypothetical protein
VRGDNVTVISHDRNRMMSSRTRFCGWEWGEESV